MDFFNFSDSVKALEKKALELSHEQFLKIDDITEYNQQRVLKAFIDNGVSESDRKSVV